MGDRRGISNRSESRGPRGKDRPRSSTPPNKFGNSNATQSRPRGQSEASRERQSKMACHVWLRDYRNCMSPQSGR
eukprot:3535967-Pyramimonas_sp.AAC.1